MAKSSTYTAARALGAALGGAAISPLSHLLRDNIRKGNLLGSEGPLVGYAALGLAGHLARSQSNTFGSGMVGAVGFLAARYFDLGLQSIGATDLEQIPARLQPIALRNKIVSDRFSD